MTRSLLFWVLMILWGLTILGVIFSPSVVYYSYGNHALEFVLFVLLGWQVYGAAIKG